MASNNSNTLSKALQGKFEMVGVQPGKIMYGPNRQIIDTRVCTAKQAAEAVKHNCRYIKRIERSSKGKA